MQNTQNKKSTFILITVAFAIFLATFNETFLNVAFFSISQDFGIALSTVQWLATAYLLGAAVMVPVASFLYRKIKTKPLFISMVLLFIIGSIVGALAQNFIMLLSGRIIQALGSGMLIPICMNITLSVAEKQKIGFYMGINGAMTTLGPSLSIIISGLLLSISSWHILLWVFGAFAVVLLIFAIVSMQNVAEISKPKLDVLSVILISIGLIGLLYGISSIMSGDWLIPLIALLVGVFCLALFVIRQNKISNPLINLSPFKIKIFTISTIAIMATLCVIFAMNVLLPSFLVGALGASEFNASLTLFPAILLSCFVAPIAGKIYDKKGAGKLAFIGFVIMTIFLVVLALCRNVSSLVLIAIIYVPLIAGTALIVGPVQSYALTKLKGEQTQAGVTIISTVFQIAGSIGSSIFISIYSANMASGASGQSSFLLTVLCVALVSALGLIASIFVWRSYRTKKQEINASDVASEEHSLQNFIEKNVYTINKNQNILEAMKIIVDKQIGGMPVVDDNNKLVGFISDGDIVRYFANSYPMFLSVYSSWVAEGNNSFEEKLQDLIKLKVSELMKSKLITITQDTSIEKACSILTENKIKKVPVVDSNGAIIGIVNSSKITKFAMRFCLDKMLKQ